MPELPEVETTLRGISPYLLNHKIAKLVVRERQLRWPVKPGLERLVNGKTVQALHRRGKYIIVDFEESGLMIHLGMSGSMRVLLHDEPPNKHDHFDLVNETGQVIRYRDPRKFGSLLYYKGDPSDHPRIAGLGVEPLTADFNAAYLYQLARRKSVSVKTFLMDGRIVVGVGNIYASESLHIAGINPTRACNKISGARYLLIADAVKQVLTGAIKQGGTTLKDFVTADGSKGYFEQSLSVYGREGQPCLNCDGIVRRIVQSQRATYYCCRCQT